MNEHRKYLLPGHISDLLSPPTVLWFGGMQMVRAHVEIIVAFAVPLPRYYLRYEYHYFFKLRANNKTIF